MIEAPPEKVQRLIDLRRRLAEADAAHTRRPPLLPHQIPPPQPWTLWLLEGGRGCGKTEACSRYFDEHMTQNPGHRGRIIAPTFSDAVEACVEGPSGLVAVNPDCRFHPASPGGSKVVWPNGSEALVLGTNSPRDVDRLRAAGNRHIDWWEEMAANPQLRRAWDQAQLGLRMGRNLVSIASTTPRQTRDYAGISGSDWPGIRNLPGTVLTHATLFDNPHNPPEWIERMRARYEGTNLGRQELFGQLVGDIEGALWRREHIDDRRVPDAPDLVRIVVAIDPAVTAGDNSDDTGIIAAGRGSDGHAYVLHDHTCHEGPQQWATRAIRLFHSVGADRLIAETNNGGDLVETVIRTQDERVPFSKVHASRGKRTRAEPIAALYEQGRVHHVGVLPELEDQMCMWVPGDEASPDRIDALVWALTELMLKGGDGTIGVPQGQLPTPDRVREQQQRGERPTGGQRGGMNDWQRRMTERQLRR